MAHVLLDEPNVLLNEQIVLLDNTTIPLDEPNALLNEPNTKSNNNSNIFTITKLLKVLLDVIILISSTIIKLLFNGSIIAMASLIVLCMVTLIISGFINLAFIFNTPFLWQRIFNSNDPGFDYLSLTFACLFTIFVITNR